MKLPFIAAGLLALVAPATAANAAAYFNTLNCGASGFACAAVNSNGSYVTTGTFGNAVTLTSSTDPSLQMKVTGWQMNQSTNAISSAWLGAYNGYGLGITGNDDPLGATTGVGGTHQIDNVNGYTDFVMLQFNQAVHLDGLNMNMYGLTGVTGKKDDYSVYNAGLIVPAINPTAWNGNINLAGYGGAPTTWANVTGLTANGYVAANASSGTLSAANGFSKVWLVGASMLTTDRNDGFKLSQIVVTQQTPPIPEPATWAMMIAGFGMIGAMLRRRAKAALAA